MSDIRPPSGSNLPATLGATRTPATSSRASAFFQAALADVAPARPSAPVAAQLQIQTQTSARPAPAKPFLAAQDPPQKLLRPGSLVNILV